jgi:hypothetical protein
MEDMNTVEAVNAAMDKTEKLTIKNTTLEILLLLKDCKDIKEAEEKIKTLLENI